MKNSLKTLIIVLILAFNQVQAHADSALNTSAKFELSGGTEPDNDGSYDEKGLGDEDEIDDPIIDETDVTVDYLVTFTQTDSSSERKQNDAENTLNLTEDATICDRDIFDFINQLETFALNLQKSKKTHPTEQQENEDQNRFMCSN